MKNSDYSICYCCTFISIETSICLTKKVINLFFEWSMDKNKIN